MLKSGSAWKTKTPRCHRLMFMQFAAGSRTTHRNQNKYGVNSFAVRAYVCNTLIQCVHLFSPEVRTCMVFSSYCTHVKQCKDEMTQSPRLDVKPLIFVITAIRGKPVYVLLGCTQSLSFLLVIGRLERARCATARETGVSQVEGSAENGEKVCLSLAPVSQLLWTREERDCVQSNVLRVNAQCDRGSFYLDRSPAEV